MRILVVGSTGVLGRNVIPRLLERGHAVVALIRRPEQAPPLHALGAEPVVGDILDAASLHRAAPQCDAALHLATAIPKEGGSWDRNNQIRREGTANLLAAAAANGVRGYVQQSITLLYGPSTTVLDESAPLGPAAYIQSAADMEAQVVAAGLDWCILRGGAFYGPGTGAEQRWRSAAQAGTLTLPGDGSELTSLIHVVDMARAVVAAVESAPPHSTYNVVDDEPVSQAALLSFAAAQVGAPPPPSGGPPQYPFPPCSNARLKAELGWQPAYPSYRSGLVME